MESLLSLSRKLTKQLLDGKKEKLGKEFFYMFSISKFILLKETILKKDSQEHILHFDNIKNKKYIPVIYELYDYIRKNGTYHIKESDSVLLQKRTNDSQKLTKALWILNKVRDSFVHGQYKFDFEHDLIIIDNNHMEENEPYSLKCAIPLNLLNGLSFFITELENNNESKESILERYNTYLKEISNEYNIDISKYLKNSFINNINKQYDNKLNIKLYDNNNYNLNYYNNNNYIYNNLDMVYDKPAISSKPKKDEYTTYDIPGQSKIKRYISVLELNELKKIISLLVNYKPKNSNEEELIYRILLEYKSIIERKEELEKEEEFHGKTQNLLNEIYHILGIKNKSKNMDAIISLYNYMALSFSYEPKIDFSYIKTDGLIFEFDQNYSNTISAIHNKCKDFNEEIEFQIKHYNDHPNDGFRHSLMDKFAKFYTDILNRLSNKNEMIIKSIRNSVEHGNYKAFKEGYVGLYDLPKQNDTSTVKFKCIATPDTLLNITNAINKESLKEEFTLEDFFNELKNIVKDDSCNKLINNLNLMSNIIFGRDLDANKTMESMYHSAIVTALNNSITKR